MKIILCGRPHGCCPIVEMEKDGYVSISNDDGQKTELAPHQWEILKNKIKAGEFD